MKDIRVPSWLTTGVLERYHSGASHLFLLHGNVRDVYPFGSVLRAARGRAAPARPRGERSPSPTTCPPVSSFPDAEREKALRKALGLKGALPADPARALVMLDALVGSDRLPPGSVAVILDYAHTLAPTDGAGAAERPERHHARALGLRSRRRRPPPLVVLIAPSAQDVSYEVYAGAAGAEVVAVPRPDLDARADFARDLQRRIPEVTWGLTPEELAAQTGGLSASSRSRTSSSARAAAAPRSRGNRSSSARSTSCARSTATCWRS